MQTRLIVTAGTLSGQVDDALFIAGQDCSEKTLAETGNRIYLYPGTLEASDLTDVFLATDPSAPDTGTAPYAVASRRSCAHCASSG